MAMAGSPGFSGYSGYTDQRCCILEPQALEKLLKWACPGEGDNMGGPLAPW